MDDARIKSTLVLPFSVHICYFRNKTSHLVRLLLRTMLLLVFCFVSSTNLISYCKMTDLPLVSSSIIVGVTAKYKKSPFNVILAVALQTSLVFVK